MNQLDIEQFKVRFEEIFRSPTQEEIAASIAKLKSMGLLLGEIVECDAE